MRIIAIVTHNFNFRFSSPASDRLPMQRSGQPLRTNIRNGKPVASNWISAKHSSTGNTTGRCTSSRNRTPIVGAARWIDSPSLARWRRQIDVRQKIYQNDHLRVPLHRSAGPGKETARRHIHGVRLLFPIAVDRVLGWCHSTTTNQRDYNGR